LGKGHLFLALFFVPFVFSMLAEEFRKFVSIHQNWFPVEFRQMQRKKFWARPTGRTNELPSSGFVLPDIIQATPNQIAL